MTNTPAENGTPAEQEPAQAPTASWDELFKGEDPAKVREALDQSRKWETRAKENNKAAQAAEQARLATMSESERAIEEARQSARAEATTAYGKRLAQSELRAIAADAGAKLPALEYLDLGRFVAEDGEPDTKAITAFVESLDKKDPAPPDSTAALATRPRPTT
jgi:hypothetical protein